MLATFRGCLFEFSAAPRLKGSVLMSISDAKSFIVFGMLVSAVHFRLPLLSAVHFRLPLLSAFHAERANLSCSNVSTSDCDRLIYFSWYACFLGCR